MENKTMSKLKDHLLDNPTEVITANKNPKQDPYKAKIQLGTGLKNKFEKELGTSLREWSLFEDRIKTNDPRYE